MDNLRSLIYSLFSDISSEMILKGNSLDSRNSHSSSNIDEGWLVDILDQKNEGYTTDEIKFLNKVRDDKWMSLPNNQINDGKLVFNILLHFSNKVLKEKNGEPIVVFEHLLRWRDLSYQLGEDIFTTSYLAYQDLYSNRDRSYFSWRMTIDNDNHLLRQVLDRGLTELHFHLKGSANIFDLNWISLMNDVVDRETSFKKMKEAKSPKGVLSFVNGNPLSLYSRCLKAAALRVYLFATLKDRAVDENIQKIIKAGTDEQVYIWKTELHAYISCLKFEFGYLMDADIFDYAIPKILIEREEKNCKSNIIALGERKLLYSAFKKSYRDIGLGKPNIKNEKFSDYLYAYLVIKNDLRREIIQVNNRIGFSNFYEYQDRKEYFIKDGSIYGRIVAASAIRTTMTDQKIDYLEARITPKDTICQLYKTIKSTDSLVQSFDEKKNTFSSEPIPECKYYYILHFIKRPYKEEKTKDKYILSRKPRNWVLRDFVKNQSQALNELRKSNTKIKDRIVGIDAASAEIGFRPEIFAQAYRFLKGYSYQSEYEYLFDTPLSQLGYTYHVGEDFLDIADGLRAIEETILFLNFKSGDRLGHALALGIDAIEYYKLKNYTLLMSKQDYIDNIVWVIKKAKILDVEISIKLYAELKSEYKRVYYEIYNTNAVDIDIYYQSWLLRGDDPMLYYSGKLIEGANFSYWDCCAKNVFLKDMEIARQNELVIKEVDKYHFNADAKLRGSKADEFEVLKGYPELIASIQEKFRFEVSNKHILIESNPSSNQVIGTYKRYANHPILSFNNKSLTFDSEELRSNPQISVSINTDDQGVFSTMLENEYALMAIALEKEKDENGNPKYSRRFIYDYLEEVRKMGFEQRFNQ